ncbi:hypothetical protein [Streptomyces sp. WAC08401]|uniref:hypothetical protein n=1 Tax=Streptomyces sp. WAC08401 TaxID=2487413 RepID=UPI00163C3354|nr:hypothetical protein [Streptomyces sp. WAC08401]
MDDEQEQEPQGYNPVVRVPAPGADTLRYRPEQLEAPLDAATHWDERIWRRA